MSQDVLILAENICLCRFFFDLAEKVPKMSCKLAEDVTKML